MVIHAGDGFPQDNGASGGFETSHVLLSLRRACCCPVGAGGASTAVLAAAPDTAAAYHHELATAQCSVGDRSWLNGARATDGFLLFRAEPMSGGGEGRAPGWQSLGQPIR